MPPRQLIVVQSIGQFSVPISQPDEWHGVGCAVCGRVLDNDPAIYSVGDPPDLRCRLCVSRPGHEHMGCTWCGREPARVQDTGRRMCQPCWTIYVAYVSDEVEPDISPYAGLVWMTRQMIEEAQYGPEPPDPPEGEDRPTGGDPGGRDVGEDQRLP